MLHWREQGLGRAQREFEAQHGAFIETIPEELVRLPRAQAAELLCRRTARAYAPVFQAILEHDRTVSFHTSYFGFLPEVELVLISGVGDGRNVAWDTRHVRGAFNPNSNLDFEAAVSALFRVDGQQER